MKLSANKGEWSELYVLIRLLADGKLFPADNNNCYLPILKIFRSEGKYHHVEYRRSDKDFIELYLNGDLVRTISSEELSKMAQVFLDATIQGQGTFHIDCAQEHMRFLECRNIKAKSDDKTDISLEVHDPFTNFNRICGYSIKSDIGEPPTLFNASQATNFKFEVLGVADWQVEKLNEKKKLRDRIEKIPDLKFVGTSATLAKNLLFVDTHMAFFLSEMLKLFYRDNISDCAALATSLEEKDPFSFGVANLYRHKIKKFLCAVALGLMPTKNWNGIDEANGGYIIVKENGSVIAYHLYNRDSFETYLLNNTKLETASTRRHKFGFIYVEEGRKYINLNLQVRFK